MLFERGAQGLEVNWLRDEGVHADREATLGFFLHRSGSQRNNGELGLADFASPNSARGFVSVLLGHVAVHKDRIERLGADRFHHIETCCGDLGAAAKFLK